MNKINEMKLFSGIMRADCTTCSRGRIESDGDYCGIHCSICKEVTGEECVEDALGEEGSINIEKSCWAPNFWLSKLLREIPLATWWSCPIEQTDGAIKEFEAQISKILVRFHASQRML